MNWLLFFKALLLTANLFFNALWFLKKLCLVLIKIKTYLTYHFLYAASSLS